MKAQRVYIDTSVLGGCFDPEFARWSNALIEDEKIMALFEAARWAASGGNEQPWRFIFATPAQTERYGKLFECLNEGNQVWAKTAPVLILTLVKTHHARTGRPNKYAWHDLGLAVGNLTTQASALDLYVHQMGGFSGDKARQLFDLPPDIEPVTMIAAGHLGDPDQLPDNLRERELAQQQRKPLAELIWVQLLLSPKQLL